MHTTVNGCRSLALCAQQAASRVARVPFTCALHLTYSARSAGFPHGVVQTSLTQAVQQRQAAALTASLLALAGLRRLSSSRYSPASSSGVADAQSAHPLGSSEGGSGDQEATCLRCVISNVSGEEAEQLSDLLLSFGAQSVVVQEHRPPGAPEQEIFEDGSGEAKLWDKCDVVAHFPLEHDVETSLALCADVLERQEPYAYTVGGIANESWVEQIKASYVPIEIKDTADQQGPSSSSGSSSMWIVPEWSEPQDPSALNIILQPGVAFGTGEHPTTRGCLLAIRRMAAAGALAGKTVMDYGAGSGVLALATLKLGAARAVGTDVDSLAVRAAARNGQLNGFDESQFQVYQCGAGLDDPEPLEQAGVVPEQRLFDVVMANILRGPLLELYPRLTGYAKPGALLLLSGILYEQALEVRELYSRDFEDFEIKLDNGWAVVTARRRAH